MTLHKMKKNVKLKIRSKDLKRKDAFREQILKNSKKRRKINQKVYRSLSKMF